MGFIDDVSGGRSTAELVADPLALFGGGGGTSELQAALGKMAGARFEQWPIQKLLPPSLRIGNTGQSLQAGIQGIGNLIQNPGQLSPTVASSLNARLASESQNIAQNFRGIGAQQAGSAARSNTPVSIKTALESALNIAQERAQRGARQDALGQSEELRRADLGQTFNLLDTILQFISSGRGQGIQGLGAAGQLNLGQQGVDAQNTSAITGLIGSIFSGLGGQE